MFNKLKEAAQLAKDLAGAVRNDLGDKAEKAKAAADTATEHAERALGIEKVRMQFMCGSVHKPYVVVLKRKRPDKFAVVAYELDVRVASSAPAASSGTVSVETDTRLADDFDWSTWTCPFCAWHGAVGVMTFLTCKCGSSQCGSTAVRVSGGTKITCDACNWTGLTQPPDGRLFVLKPVQSQTALPPAQQTKLLK